MARSCGYGADRGSLGRDCAASVWGTALRRAFFAVALLAGLTMTASGARAGDPTIGSDMPWPSVPSADDEPAVQAAPAPGGGQTNAQRRRATGASSTAAIGEPHTPSSQDTDSGDQPAPKKNATERSDDRDRQTLRRASGRSDERLEPPFPERRKTSAETPQPAVIGGASLAQTVSRADAEDKLGKMVGQMIVLGFDGAAPDEEWPKRIIAQIEAGRIGGVLFADRNIRSPGQLKALTGAFRAAKAALPPFLAVAQEGGAVHCLPADRGFRAYPSAGQLGRQNDPLNAYGVYQAMAAELASLGFNVNLGPVLDLDSENAPGAADRDYGSQPKHVAAFAKAFRLAHSEEGILTVLKHFPGRVAAAQAADNAADKAGSGWNGSALEPYRQLTANGNTDMVMVGHAAHPDFSDEPGLAASLSANAVQRILRNDVGYHGVIISDDLEAIDAAQHSPIESLAVRAFIAGNDIVLIGNRLAPATDLPARIVASVKEAIASGALSEERIEASYQRIVVLKQRLSPSGKAIASAVRADKPAARPSNP